MSNSDKIGLSKNQQTRDRKKTSKHGKYRTYNLLSTYGIQGSCNGKKSKNIEYEVDHICPSSLFNSDFAKAAAFASFLACSAAAANARFCAASASGISAKT